MNKFLITLLLLNFTFGQMNAAAPDAPFNLRSFDKQNPIGTGDKPYFGWYVNDPDNNEVQTAYEIIVSSTLSNSNAGNGDVWNSGKVISGMQNYIYYQGKQLAPATLYYWKIRTWDKDGNVSPYSEVATFETGLLTNNDWAGANWIKRETQESDDYTYYRKNVTIPNKKVKRAVVYIAACQSYELYINGKFVGKGFDNHYPQYSYYNAWDISGFVNGNEENLFACLTHWYGGGQGRAKGERGLLFKAVIEYDDASQTIIGSDKTWKQAKAEQWNATQPQRNGEGIGRIELFDSRKVISNWNLLDFNDSNWMPATEIGPHPVASWTGVLRADLTQVIENEIKPVAITDLGKGKYVIDLGKIYSGSFKINFNGGVAGDTIKMMGGFVLNEDGTVSTKLNQETKLNFYFVHNGSAAVFNPYVYLGIRYLQVDNSPNVLTKENVSYITRHFELTPSRSSFESSNKMLNNVWDLMVHSLVVGAQESFVDTPTREKGGFLGDGWSQAVPNMSVMGDRTMNMRILNEFLDSQEQYWPDGRMNAVYPNVDGGRDIPDFTQFYLFWAWDYYMQTGNKEFLQTNYLKLRKIAEYVDTYKNDASGLIHKLKGGKGPYEFGIIDWPAGMRYGYDMSVEARTVINAYAYANFDIISKIASLVGNSTDKDVYQAKADGIKTAMNSLLINKEGVYIDGISADKVASTHVSQHANAIPYALNIVPNNNKKQVVDAIKERKMNVGMICLRWLPEALGQADEAGQLIELYTNTEWDGWAKTVALGGTVTWESWNANLVNESMSHPWGAVGLLGIQNYVLGVKSITPQNEIVQIKPLWFGDKLTSAKGIYTTDKGDIAVDWSFKNDTYTLKITIPDNMTAKVYLPKCGKKGNALKMDKKKTNGIEVGEYIRIDNVGSGEHLFKLIIN